MSKVSRETLLNLVTGGISLTCLFILSHLSFSSPLITTGILLFTLLYGGYLFAISCFPRHGWIITLVPGCILFLSCQSLFQTIWYYAGFALNHKSDLLSIGFALICAMMSSIFIHQTSTLEDTEQRKIYVPINGIRLFEELFYVLSGIGLSGLLVWQALKSGTTISIRTPWPLMGEHAFTLIAMLWLLFFWSIVRHVSTITTFFLSFFTLGATLAISPLIYRLGFGFDGFLHIASEKILLTTGTLHPQPLYYMGQYVFTTWLARISDLPLEHIDRWLVPLGTSVLLSFILLLLARGSSQNRLPVFGILGLLPLTGFITTTPQGFAYLLGFAALLLTYGVLQDTVHPIAPFLLAGWSLASHPLAGLPLLLIVSALILRQKITHSIIARIISWILVIGASVSITILFFILSLRQNTPIAWNLESLFALEAWINHLRSFVPFIGNRFVLWPAWGSLVVRLVPWFLLGLGLVTIALQRRHRSPERESFPGLWLTGALLLWTASIVLKITGDFSFLIDYERGNYADRLNTLALFCLIPAGVPALIWLYARAKKTPRFIRVAGLGFCIAMATALAYDSLPRHDAVVPSRGWSTSMHDMEAVKLIDRDAGTRPYTVLANQSVSAAAVSVLGFKRYAGDIFFYPIPTGGPLYELYLRMTYQEASRDTVKDAAQLGQTDLVYVVINDYWWRAATLTETIRGLANRDWDIGDGKVRVYKFDLNAPSNASTTTVGS